MYIAHYVMFTKMSSKKGIRQFGERAVSAMLKNWEKLNDGPMHGNPVFGPLINEELSSDYRKKALETANLTR